MVWMRISSRVLVSPGREIGLTAITAAILFAANIVIVNTAEGTAFLGFEGTNGISSPAPVTVVHLELVGEPDRYLITNGSLSRVFDSIAEQPYNFSTINLVNQIDNNTRTIIQGINNIDELEQEFVRVANSTEITTQPTAQQVYRLIVVDCDEECDVLTCINLDVWCGQEE